MQLHLGRIIATAGDLELSSRRETLAVELEKPLGGNGVRGRIDVWFGLTDQEDCDWRCAIELKFFKRENQREPNNRYDVFKDLARLESCGDVADLGYMLVATDHPHYRSHPAYSESTRDFDFRDGSSYTAGTVLTYRTDTPHGDPIKLMNNYQFQWDQGTDILRYLLLEVEPNKANRPVAGALDIMGSTRLQE